MLYMKYEAADLQHPRSGYSLQPAAYMRHMCIYYL